MTNQVTRRRAFSLSLPAADPNSAPILRWLEQQPPTVDVSPLIRQALATWLICGPLLEQIAAQLSRVEARLEQARPLLAPAPAPAAPDAETAAILDQLLDFGHLE
jgi:hypothetical protein